MFELLNNKEGVWGKRNVARFKGSKIRPRSISIRDRHKGKRLSVGYDLGFLIMSK